MSEYLKSLALLCPLIFLGGFIDSIAGGGGLITLPAYLLVGFPSHLAAGTNKLIASCGSLTSSAKYIKSGVVDFKVAVFSAAGALMGGALGSRIALMVPDRGLKLIIMVALPAVAVFMAIKRDFGKASSEKTLSPRVKASISLCIGIAMGAYDGLVGPGAGTFMIFLFTAFLGLDMLISSACARVTNLASNIASLVVFVANGKVDFTYFAPLALCAFLGNWLGARRAIKGGSGQVRKMMFVVMALLFVKIAWDFFA